MEKTKVTYAGILDGKKGTSRVFPTRSRAEQWARQAGVFTKAKFEPVAEANTAEKVVEQLLADEEDVCDTCHQKPCECEPDKAKRGPFPPLM